MRDESTKDGRHTRSGSTRRLLALATGALTAAGAMVATPAASDAPPGPQARAAAVPLNHCVDDDNGLPEWGAPSFSATTVDASSGDATVTVSVPLTDTGGPGPANGVQSVRAWVGSLDDPRLLPFSSRLDLTQGEGDVWSAEMTVPQHAPAGDYAITDLEAYDGVNRLELTSSNAAVADDPLFTSTFEVLSDFDDAAPEVTSLSGLPRRVNTRKKAKKVRLTVDATDLSGIETVGVVVSHKGQREYVDLERRGDHFTDTLRVRKFVGNATWRVRQVTVVDRIGNRTHVRGDDMRALGRTTFKVRSRVDRAAPKVGKVRLRPTPLNIRHRGRTLHFTAKLRDTRAGVASAVAIIPDHAVELRRVSGNARKGTWRGKLRLDTCVDLPKWPRLRIVGTDRVGNENDQIVRKFRARSRDRMPPRITVERPSDGSFELTGPVRFRFSEKVTGVDADSVSVRLGTWPEPGPELTGTWACFGKNGNARSCGSRHVRFAEWTPEEPLAPDADYRFVFNPEGDLGIRDAAGNPPRRVELSAPTVAVE